MRSSLVATLAVSILALQLGAGPAGAAQRTVVAEEFMSPT